MDNLNVDMLLDSEVAEIENSILEKQKEEKPSEINKPAPSVVKAKSPSKNELMETYIQLCIAAGREPETESRLKRMTKSELTKKIAEIMNQEVGGEIKKPEREEQEQKSRPQVEMNSDNLNCNAEFIFNMNLVLCSLFETGSVALKDKTFGVALLENWPKEVYGKKQELISIFKKLYAEYKEVLDPYLSPVTMWASVMVQTGMSVAQQNYQKKKEESKKE